MHLNAWQELSDYKLFDSAFVSSESLLGNEDYWSFYQKLKRRDLHDYNLHNEDRISSLFSLENRVPFLSKTLITLSESIPDALRATLLLDKTIVRKGLLSAVGESLASRKKCHSFMVNLQASPPVCCTGALLATIMHWCMKPAARPSGTSFSRA